MTKETKTKQVIIRKKTVADKAIKEVEKQQDTSTVPPSKGKARAQAATKKNDAKRVIKPVVPVILDERPVDKKTRKPQKRSKVSNYDHVDAGNCPHCILVQPFTQKTLQKDVAGKGDGVTRTCKLCQHKWYINRKIRTCACRTCQKAKKKEQS
jgi:hypothetical protein